jgi:hypothetical protein
MVNRASKTFHILEISWILTNSWKRSQVVVVAFGLKEMPETEIPGHCPHPGMTRRCRNVQREILRIAHEVTSRFTTIPNQPVEEVEWIKPGAMGLPKTNQRDL